MYSILIPNIFPKKFSVLSWKSNWRLANDLKSGKELDLLTAPEDYESYCQYLLEIGFVRATLNKEFVTEKVSHFYGLIPDTVHIAHLHVYGELVTGGGLLKNHKLPVSPYFTKPQVVSNGVPVPSTEVELGVFLVRKYLELSSPFEAFFALREKLEIQRELEWLVNNSDLEKAKVIFDSCFSKSSTVSLHRWIEGVRSPRWGIQQVLLALRMRYQARRYKSSSELIAEAKRCWLFLSLLTKKFLKSEKIVSPVSKGIVFAIVGGEATGKSTTVDSVASWLEEHFSVLRVHSGKPPWTLLSALPSICLPFFRKMFHHHRTNVIELDSLSNDDEEKPRSLMYVIRSVLIAYDQRAALLKAHKHADRGKIVVCDRYPSKLFGGMDGPRLAPELYRKTSTVKYLLSQIEEKLYASIPDPRFVIKLTVPLEVALERNAKRVKKGEPETPEYVIKRHSLMYRWGIPDAKVIEIENIGDVSEHIKSVKQIVWKEISSQAAKVAS